jgi:hypothetical protein
VVGSYHQREGTGVRRRVGDPRLSVAAVRVYLRNT